MAHTQYPITSSLEASTQIHRPQQGSYIIRNHFNLASYSLCQLNNCFVFGQEHCTSRGRPVPPYFAASGGSDSILGIPESWIRKDGPCEITTEEVLCCTWADKPRATHFVLTSSWATQRGARRKMWGRCCESEWVLPCWGRPAVEIVLFLDSVAPFPHASEGIPRGESNFFELFDCSSGKLLPPPHAHTVSTNTQRKKSYCEHNRHVEAVFVMLTAEKISRVNEH